MDPWVPERSGELSQLGGRPWTQAISPRDGVELGRCLGPWGVKGWVHVHPYSSDADALTQCAIWYLETSPPASKQPKPSGPRDADLPPSIEVRVLSCRPHADGLVAQFEGVDNREEALRLKGRLIKVSRQLFPILPEGEYYWIDLMGLQVINREGLALGVVREMMSTGPHAVMVLDVVASEAVASTRERLIPFVAAYVDRVDLQERRIVVDWQPDY